MKVTIIAEAGVNHNGKLELAKQLIDVAAEAGADYVKFQTFKTEKNISKTAKKAAYQIENTNNAEESQFEMVKKLELDEATHLTLINYCKQKNIKFLSTAFDHESVDLLDELGINVFKIPSGEITNLPYINKVASKKKPIILSTGMADMGEIEDVLDILYAFHIPKEDITVLHCNTEYPTPMEDVNLTAMNSIAEAFKVKVGYSDHTLGIEVPIAAVARGAVCIEKHFTLDRNLPGPDHKASLEPEELKQMVMAVRNIEKALGNGIKKPSKSEKKNIPIARKSIHLAHRLEKGVVIQSKDLLMKRPGTGISPMYIDWVIGKSTLRTLEKDTLLTLEDIQ